MIEWEVRPSAAPKERAGTARQAVRAVVVARMVSEHPACVLTPFHWRGPAWDVQAVLVSQGEGFASGDLNSYT